MLIIFTNLPNFIRSTVSQLFLQTCPASSETCGSGCSLLTQVQFKTSLDKRRRDSLCKLSLQTFFSFLLSCFCTHFIHCFYKLTFALLLSLSFVIFFTIFLCYSFHKPAKPFTSLLKV